MKQIIFTLCVFCVLCGLTYGANEIRGFYTSGNTCYAVIRNSTGQAWDTAGNAFETWNVMSDYDITLTDKSGGMYLGNFDTDIVAGFYTIMIYKQLGGSPADSDTALLFEEGYWTSTVWKSTTGRLDDIKTETAAILEDTGTTLDTDIQSILGNQTVINNNITDSNSTIMAELAGLSVDVDVNEIAVAVRLEMDANSTQLAAIVEDTGTTIPALINDVNDNIATDLTTIIADTNELQTDWADGGRLDILMDWIISRIKRLVPSE